MKATSCFLELSATIACQKQSFVVYLQLSKVLIIIVFLYHDILSNLCRFVD